jgi:hypothetical protein
MRIRHHAFISAFLLTAVGRLSAGSVELAQPLFVIERNTNANVVHYDAKLTPAGELDPDQPVTAYWVMAAEDGRREELTSLERKRVYGFRIQPAPDGSSYFMGLVSQRRRDIHIYRRGNSIYAETLIGGRRAYLTKVYVTAHKVLAIPEVKTIELFGRDVETGELLHETVQP